MNPVLRELCKRLLKSETGEKLSGCLYVIALFAFIVWAAIFVFLWEGSQP